MTIHSEHPFRDSDLDPVRRLRGRVGATVSLWTAGDLATDAAGLTVSSYLILTGEPGRIVGAIDPDSDLFAAMERTGLAVVQLLTYDQHQIADTFGGQLPAPGGLFAGSDFEATPYGPRLMGAGAWAFGSLEDARPLGWSNLTAIRIENVGIDGDDDFLVHRRGRYQSSQS